MEAEHPLDEEIGEVFGVGCRGAWYQVSLLGQAVYHHPDGITTVGLGESHNKVHANVLPWCLGDWK